LHGKHREPQTEDFEEEWFTSGEAINLACQPNTDIPCDLAEPGDPVQNPISDIADNRDWRTTEIDEELQQEVTTEQIQEYQEAWQLTQGEIENLELAKESDFGEESFELPFDSSDITDMIDSVLEVVS